VPHVHEYTDNTLSFTVSLRAIDAGKLLADTVLPASCNESMIAGSFNSGAIVGVSAVNPIRALDDGLQMRKQAALC